MYTCRQCYVDKRFLMGPTGAKISVNHYSQTVLGTLALGGVKWFTSRAGVKMVSFTHRHT